VRVAENAEFIVICEDDSWSEAASLSDMDDRLTAAVIRVTRNTH